MKDMACVKHFEIFINYLSFLRKMCVTSKGKIQLD